MAKDISIISRLKKIALTSLELGREIAKEKANQVSSTLRESRASKLLESTQQRIDQALRRNADSVKAKTSVHKHSQGKRHLGAAKYSAKHARLSQS